MNSQNFATGPHTRRQWIKQFALGSVAALGASGWRGRLLADISPDAAPADILPIHLATDFPGVLDGSTPSIQIQISSFPEIIMINKGPGLMYVLNSTCTHQGCPVSAWNAADNILCPCHGSNYNIDGSLIHGAAGPNQPPLASYDFDFDGSDLLQIYVPGLNLKIDSIAIETKTAGNTRLRLSFPGRAATGYYVLYAPDLTSDWAPVQISLTANGSANHDFIFTDDTAPLAVWVDNPGTKGFYRIQIAYSQYFN